MPHLIEGLRGSWSDVSLVSGQYVEETLADFTLSPVPENTLTICLGGRAKVFRRMGCDETSFAFETSDIFHQEQMTPGDGFRWEGTAQMLHVFISPQVFSHAERVVLGSEAGRRRFTCATPFRDERIVRIGEALMAEAREPSPGAELMTHALAEQLSLLVMRLHLSRGATAEVTAGRLDEGSMRALHSFAMAHLGGDLSLERLAHVAGMGVPHFCTLFRKNYGVTPHDWVMQLRLDAASDLLRGSEHPLAEIAERTGFADQSHFTRRFKQRFGTSPNKWRSSTLTRRNRISVNPQAKGVQDNA